MADPLTGSDLETAIRRVRLLLSDVDENENDRVFSDTDLQDFLALEGWVVKLAAAQAIDTNATNEVLASKVLRTKAGVETDGAKVADAMRKHATNLRAQAANELVDSEADGAFVLVSPVSRCPRRPELTERPTYPFC